VNPKSIEKHYQLARELYAEKGVDSDKALAILNGIQLSLPCWQTDDVTGLEYRDKNTNNGGIMATGNYPGRARNITEIRTDLEKVLTLIPGRHRIGLHAMYGDFQGQKVDRNEIDPTHFQSWIDWAKELQIGLDFNSTYFAHSLANSGFTLSSKNETIRSFWVEHGKRCREIAARIGEAQGSPCLHNTWIPDGSKDLVIDKWGYRENLRQSLDEIFTKPYPQKALRDSVESKLFGLGSETFVVGSYDFYLSYALKKQIMICLDMGHFHPTESVADKLSAILQFSDNLLLHITRSVRWDSDHVPILNQELLELTKEIVRNRLLDRIFLALDFFDASINRISAYVIGIRATLIALLAALLEPIDKLLKSEKTGKTHITLSLVEDYKTMPINAVWDYYCLKSNVPPGIEWIPEVEKYEEQVLSKRK